MTNQEKARLMDEVYKTGDVFAKAVGKARKHGIDVDIEVYSKSFILRASADFEIGERKKK